MFDRVREKERREEKEREEDIEKLQMVNDLSNSFFKQKKKLFFLEKTPTFLDRNFFCSFYHSLLSPKSSRAFCSPDMASARPSIIWAGYVTRGN